MAKGVNMKFVLYCLRWQLSTPILAPITGGLTVDSFFRAAIANIIGASIFYWVDKWIFSNKRKSVVNA